MDSSVRLSAGVERFSRGATEIALNPSPNRPAHWDLGAVTETTGVAVGVKLEGTVGVAETGVSTGVSAVGVSFWARAAKAVKNKTIDSKSLFIKKLPKYLVPLMRHCNSKKIFEFPNIKRVYPFKVRIV